MDFPCGTYRAPSPQSRSCQGTVLLQGGEGELLCTPEVRPRAGQGQRLLPQQKTQEKKEPRPPATPTRLEGPAEGTRRREVRVNPGLNGADVSGRGSTVPGVPLQSPGGGGSESAARARGGAGRGEPLPPQGGERKERKKRSNRLRPHGNGGRAAARAARSSFRRGAGHVAAARAAAPRLRQERPQEGGGG